MSAPRTSKVARRATAAAAIGIGALAAIPSAASAATTTNACDASAVQLSLLGSPAIEPLRANAAFTPCATDDRTLVDLPILGLARVSALEASTKVTAGKEAVSNTRIAGVRLGADAALGDLLRSKLLSGPSSIVGQVTRQVDGLLGPLGAGPLAGLLGAGAAGANPVAALPAGLGGLLGGLPVVGGAAGGLPVLGGLQLQGTSTSTLLSSITDALPGALAAALPDILDVGVLRSTATAQCVSGTAKLSGSSSIADLKILGTSIDVNSAAGRALSLDTADLQLGKLLSVTDLLKGIKVGTTGLLGQLLAGSNGGSTETTLYDLLHSRDAGVVGLVNGLLGGQTLGSLATSLANTLQPLLDQIRIQLPPGLLRVTIDANRQTITGDQLSQQVLAVGVQLLGQPVLAAGVGRARVSSGAAGCAPPVAPKAEPPKKDAPAPKPKPTPKKKYPSPVAKEVLKCSTRPAQLIDVYGTHGRTFVQGVAQKRFVGKTAKIYLRHGGKRVGSAKVLKNGMFSTRVALPPSSIRYTNSARYFAVVSGRRTRALKFARRMATTSITSKGRRVTFKGRVLGPRQARQQPILIKQRVTCKTYRTIKRVVPDASGRFQVRMSAPSKLGAGIYRAQTHVIESPGTTKLFPTYTLPRPVGLD
ncbi:hypothetical protein [Patulibacter minatonensis]|uniref:hypothetical protein n=1 Tax=Patulibacter minatonensis TaxID=298163 RepID=UPI00047E98CD|nr:hypothetical protein [Patulibacter minatonensis]